MDESSLFRCFSGTPYIAFVKLICYLFFHIYSNLLNVLICFSGVPILKDGCYPTITVVSYLFVKKDSVSLLIYLRLCNSLWNSTTCINHKKCRLDFRESKFIYIFIYILISALDKWVSIFFIMCNVFIKWVQSFYENRLYLNHWNTMYFLEMQFLCRNFHYWNVY